MTAHVSYAYAVARPATGLADVLSAIRGVADEPVHLVEEPGMVAVVSGVPADDFDENSLRTHLEDLDWLESVARAHNVVVDATAALTTVLPLRLATIYRDDDRVRHVLRSQEETFGTLLERLAGRVEWGVKLYVVPPTAPPSVPSPADRAADVGAGRAYLRSRRRERTGWEDAWRAAEEAQRRVEEEARRLATDRSRHQPHHGGLDQGPGQNVVNDAYLVPRELGEEFRTRVAHAAEGLDGVRVEVTGPWAPYSFTAPAENGIEKADEAAEAERGAHGQ